MSIDLDQNIVNGIYSEGSASTPSIGAYMTWLNKEGWFADATLRSFFSNMDMTTYSAANQAIDYSPSRQFTVFSAEFGRQLKFKTGKSSAFLLEPKVELSYAFAAAKDFTTSFGDEIEYGTTTSLVTRAGVLFGYGTKIGKTIYEPFVELAVAQELDGKTDITYAGEDYTSDLSGTTFEVSAGLNVKLPKAFNIYSDVTFESSNVIDAVSINLGLRYNF